MTTLTDAHNSDILVLKRVAHRSSKNGFFDDNQFLIKPISAYFFKALFWLLICVLAGLLLGWLVSGQDSNAEDFESVSKYDIDMTIYNKLAHSKYGAQQNAGHPASLEFDSKQRWLQQQYVNNGQLPLEATGSGQTVSGPPLINPKMRGSSLPTGTYRNEPAHSNAHLGDVTAARIYQNRSLGMTAYDGATNPLQWQQAPAKELLYCTENVARVLQTQRIRFSSGSALLTVASANLLHSLSGILFNCPNVNINIEGHTDSTGLANANQVLSLARANSVKRMLTKNGIKESRINAAGIGSSQPLLSNDTERGRAANRRIELNLYQNAKP